MRLRKGKFIDWMPEVATLIFWAGWGSFLPVAGAQGWPPQWEVLGRRVSVQQALSASYRDHSQYQQKIVLTQIEAGKGDWPERSKISLRIAAETSPNEKGEVLMRAVSVSDGEGKPVAGGGKDLGILAEAAFWEELFYPFFPEKMKRLEILEIQETEENGQAMLKVQFATRENLKGAPNLEGLAHISPSSGDLMRMELSNVRGLESIDKQGSGLTISRVDVDYTSPEPGIRLPGLATLEGTSKSKPFKGGFRLRYQESMHTVVQTVGY